jgi:DNA-directed RNA polymerase subunit RPC12/RpoP
LAARLSKTGAGVISAQATTANSMNEQSECVANLDGVWAYGGYLGVRCLHCNHRAVFHQSRMSTIRAGNRTKLHSLKLRCARCGLVGRGKAYWEMCAPSNEEEARAFLRGDDIGRSAVLDR